MLYYIPGYSHIQNHSSWLKIPTDFFFSSQKVVRIKYTVKYTDDVRKGKRQVKYHTDSTQSDLMLKLTSVAKLQDWSLKLSSEADWI